VAPLFAVTVSDGPKWQSDLPMETQEEWTAHAAFMNGLVDEGLVLLGGPLEGIHQRLLIVRADDAEHVKLRLEEDPWHSDGLLRIATIAPWTLRLGSLD